MDVFLPVVLALFFISNAKPEMARHQNTSADTFYLHYLT